MLYLRLAPLTLVLLAGCVAIRVPPYSSPVSEVRAAHLMSHVEALTEIGPRPQGDVEQTERTLDYLEEQLISYGLQVQAHRLETRLYGEVVNLIATKRGTEEPERFIEIGAHYDTVANSPGADDNSSGVAGVLECARILAPLSLKRSVRFCLFGAEEIDLIGSFLHVRSLGDRKDETVEGTFILEMIGYFTEAEDSQHAPIRIPLIAYLPHKGNFIAVVGNFSSGWLGNLYEDAADRYAPGLRYFSANRIGGFFADAARSDHFPYWQAERDAIMITDTANFRNKNYHKPTDTPDTLNPIFMERVTQAMVAAALMWAEENDHSSGENDP